jgi:hypothetical protein
MKKKIVYFLGAGCSAAFGYPLTGELMPKVLATLQKKSEVNKELMSLLKLIYPKLDHNSKTEHIPGIIEVLSLIDYSHFYNIPPHPKIGKVNIPVLKELMSNALIKMLIDYDNNDWDWDDADEEQQAVHFENFIKHIRQQLKKGNLSFITTNYDLIIDILLDEIGKIGKIDYGIAYRDFENGKIIKSLQDADLQYYKLHGSHNWLRCPVCGFYYINPYGCISQQYFVRKATKHNTCHCNDDEKLQPVLVAPSTIRDIRDPNLLQIWNMAQESIRLADKIVFIGYSLPAEDIAIKSMLLRGLNSNKKFNKGRLTVEVVQQSDAARINYESLITNGKLDYRTGGLEKWLDA